MIMENSDKKVNFMTEEEKLDAGLYYDFWDTGVNRRKLNAIRFCRELRKLQDQDASEDEQAILIRQYFGTVGSDVCLCPGFMCDNGKNIHVGDQFLANYNVTSDHAKRTQRTSGYWKTGYYRK